MSGRSETRFLNGLRRRDSPAGILVRRLLPATIGLPLLIGLLRVAGERSGLYSTHVGITIMVGCAIAGSTALLLWTARIVDRVDRERRRTAAALALSARHHRTLARHFPDGAILLFDRDLRQMIADGSGLASVGLSSGQMEGKTIWEVFPAEVCTAIEPAYRAALAGDQSSFEFSYAERTYLVQVVPVPDDEGTAIGGGAAMVWEITARKRQEEQLREADERFARFFENAPIGEAIVGLDGRFLQVNPALCELVGYEASDLLEVSFQEITHPDDLDDDLDFVRAMLAGEIRAYAMVKRYLHKLGEVVWIQLSVSLVRNSEGEPRYFISQIEDITQRKLAADLLGESERRLAEAQRIAGLGSWEWRVGDDTVLWSDELHHIYGTAPGLVEPTFAAFLDRVHPDDRALADEAIQGALGAGEPFSFEHRIVTPEGEIRTLLTEGQVERDGRGSPVRMLGVAQDVTERRRSDRRIQEAERRYRTLAEQLPLVTYIRPLELAAPNIYTSPQAEQLFGYAIDDWQQEPALIERILHPDDRERVLAAGARIRRTGEAVRDEYRLIARDGSVVWVQDAAHLIRDESGTPTAVQGYLVDVTERKQAEAERDRLRDDLYHAQKVEAIGQLASGVAHEFNNALMAITGHAALLEGRLAAGDVLRRDVEQILGSSERATVVTRQLLAFGRKQVFQPRAIDVNQVVTACGELLRPLLDARVELLIVLDPTLPVTVADPGQLEQVVVNLVLNSRDAITTDGTITIRTGRMTVDEETAARRSVERGDYLAIAVADTGSGIDEQTATRIFEPFFTTKEVGKGTGLGLSTADGIVRQGGGFIAVDTAPGSGTTMTVVVPQRADGPGDLPGGSASAAAGARRSRALVVDDEEAVREICAELLANAGYDVSTAVDGADAVWQLERSSGPLGLLLTDVLMPNMGGPELARRVVQLHPNAAVVFMSGHPGEQLPDLELSVETTFLQKPFTRAELEDALGHGTAKPGAQTRD